MSVLVDGKPEEIPGVLTRSPHEDQKLQLNREDYAVRPRRSDGTFVRVRGIVFHTTEGRWPQVVWPTAGKPGGAERYIARSKVDHRCAAAHLWIDRDGVTFCSSDLLSTQTHHATSVNPLTIGIEIVQGPDGALYRPQIEAAVLVTDWATRHPRFRIQRQTVDHYRGALSRLATGAGRDFVGVYGHRDQTTNRGRGDPGDAIFDALEAAGYERFNVAAKEDLERWKSRQTVLGFRGADVDGIPLDKTCDALEASGKKHGLWVARPGD